MFVTKALERACIVTIVLQTTGSASIMLAALGLVAVERGSVDVTLLPPGSDEAVLETHRSLGVLTEQRGPLEVPFQDLASVGMLHEIRGFVVVTILTPGSATMKSCALGLVRQQR